MHVSAELSYFWSTSCSSGRTYCIPLPFDVAKLTLHGNLNVFFYFHMREKGRQKTRDRGAYKAFQWLHWAYLGIAPRIHFPFSENKKSSLLKDGDLTFSRVSVGGTENNLSVSWRKRWINKINSVTFPSDTLPISRGLSFNFWGFFLLVFWSRLQRDTEFQMFVKWERFNIANSGRRSLNSQLYVERKNSTNCISVEGATPKWSIRPSGCAARNVTCHFPRPFQQKLTRPQQNVISEGTSLKTFSVTFLSNLSKQQPASSLFYFEWVKSCGGYNISFLVNQAGFVNKENSKIRPNQKAAKT